MLHFRDSAAREEERREEGEEDAPGMDRMRDCGEGGCEDADGGQGVVGVGTVDEGEGCGDPDVGFHFEGFLE